MVQDQYPAYLPLPLASKPNFQRDYLRAYESTRNVDGVVADGRWHETRIPHGLSAKEVYRRLPTATDCLYEGYLTKNRIRYQMSGENWANTVAYKSRPCTFHSQPTANPYADIPSMPALYHFLKWRHQRHITVGNHWIWVWNKDAKTLNTVQRLMDWESENMVKEVNRLCGKEASEAFFQDYCGCVLKALGLKEAFRPRVHPDAWSRVLQETLAIKTVLIRREA